MNQSNRLIEFRRRRRASKKTKDAIAKGVKAAHRKAGRGVKKATGPIRKTGGLINENIKLRNQKLKGDQFDRRVGRVVAAGNAVGSAGSGIAKASLGIGAAVGTVVLAKKASKATKIAADKLGTVKDNIASSSAFKAAKKLSQPKEIVTSVAEKTKEAPKQVITQVGKATGVKQGVEAFKSEIKKSSTIPHNPNSVGGKAGRLFAKARKKAKKDIQTTKKAFKFSSTSEEFWYEFGVRKGITDEEQLLEFARKGKSRKRTGHSAQTKAKISRALKGKRRGGKKTQTKKKKLDRAFELAGKTAEVVGKAGRAFNVIENARVNRKVSIRDSNSRRLGAIGSLASGVGSGLSGAGKLTDAARKSTKSGRTTYQNITVFRKKRKKKSSK